MARAALEWTLDQLADAAGIGRRTVAKYVASDDEAGTVQLDKVEAMRRAFEAAGVHFLMNGPHKGGVVPPRSAPVDDQSGRNPTLQR